MAYTRVYNLNPDRHYIAMALLNKTSSLTVKLDGSTLLLQPNVWKAIKKINNTNEATLTLSGSAKGVSGDVRFLEITKEEFDESDNLNDLLLRYNEDIAQREVDQKQAEINAKEIELEEINTQINDLKYKLSIEQNFTPLQIIEKKKFEFEKEYINENCITEQQLLDAALEELPKICTPTLVVTVDIVDFLSIIEEQNKWKMLNLGDTIRVYYEKIGIHVTAKIVEMDIDYEEGSISITIANTKKYGENEDKVLEMISKSNTTSATVELGKYKWGAIEETTKKINSFLESAFDATKQKILAGTNESVEISNRGLMIKNPEEPNKYLVANHAVLAITNNGGKSYDHAITTDGIIGKRIIGEIIIGESLKMQNSIGTFEFTKDGVVIDNTALTINGGLDGSQVDSLGVKFNEEHTNFYTSNDNISAFPHSPDFLPNGDAIKHYYRADGNIDVSLEWEFEGETDEYDVDGFEITAYFSNNSSPYAIGTSQHAEHKIIVKDNVRGIVLRKLPANKYITFAVQSYRIVNDTVAPSKLMRSSPALSPIDTEKPYYPPDNTAHTGDLINYINPLYKGETRTIGSLSEGKNYNGVVLSGNSGLVVTRSDDNVRSIFNATDGIKIQNKRSGNWNDVFYTDIDGVINAKGLVISSDDGTSVMIDAKNKTINFSEFNTIAGKITATNLDVGDSLVLDGTNISAYKDKDKTGASGYVRMGVEGLFIKKGVFDFRTKSNSDEGIVFDKNGFRSYADDGSLLVDINTSGSIFFKDAIVDNHVTTLEHSKGEALIIKPMWSSVSTGADIYSSIGVDYVLSSSKGVTHSLAIIPNKNNPNNGTVEIQGDLEIYDRENEVVALQIKDSVISIGSSFNNRVSIDAQGNIARWRHNQFNYIRQDNSDIRFYFGGESTMYFYAKNESGNINQLIRMGGTTLKGLASGDGLQVRNNGDDAYHSIRASDFNVASKRKFKDNIVLFDKSEHVDQSAMDMVKSLNIYTFNYKGRTDISIGSMWEESPDILKGKKDGETLSQSNQIGLLFKTSQELITMVENQQKKIQKLEALVGGE